MTLPVGVGFDIARPDGRARVDDHDRQTLPRQFHRHLFRLPFRTLVMIAHMSASEAAADLIRRRDLARFRGLGKPMQPTVLV